LDGLREKVCSLRRARPTLPHAYGREAVCLWDLQQAFYEKRSPFEARQNTWIEVPQRTEQTHKPDVLLKRNTLVAFALEGQLVATFEGKPRVGLRANLTAAQLRELCADK